jgi:YbgC/YbaW family acyl-CoA thioester hydrolase
MKSSSRPGGHAGTSAFEIRERVRLSDTDASGIIQHGAFVRLADLAETEFFRALGFASARFGELGVMLPRVHVEFDFFRPARCDDELALRVSVAGVGVHSYRLAVEIVLVEHDVLVAEATIVAACVDHARRSVPLPDAFAAALRAALPTDS